MLPPLPGPDPALDDARLAHWLAGMPAARDWLQEQSGLALDGTATQHVALWSWALGQLSTQGLDPDTAQESLLALPEWLVVPAHDRAWTTYSAHTLWVIDALAHYHGACVAAEVPSLQWVVFRDARVTYPEEGEVALVLGPRHKRTGWPLNIFPVRDVKVIVSRALSWAFAPRVPDLSPDALARLHEMRVAVAREQLDQRR